MALTSTPVPSTHHLLHPWDEADTSSAVPLVFTAYGDKISIARDVGDEGDQGEEIALETHKEKLQALIYHPKYDTPIVVVWDEDGITVRAHDATQEGMRVALDFHR